MCNIIAIKSIDNVNTSNYIQENLDKIIDTLVRRGRDNFSACILNNRKIRIFNSSDIDEFKDLLIDNIQPTIDLLILHSRAIPETEFNSYKGSNIYNKRRFIIAHHGIIPNAEKINPNISIDSETLADIYKDIDYSNVENWFIDNLKKYPRATTEILFDKQKYKMIVATTFMPLYYTNSCDFYIYTTDNSLIDNMYPIAPYSILVL